MNESDLRAAITAELEQHHCNCVRLMVEPLIRAITALEVQEELGLLGFSLPPLPDSHTPIRHMDTPVDDDVRHWGAKE